MPMKRFVFTHFPPFAANGSNREQFQHIADAADLMHRLEESETVALFTGQSRNESKPEVLGTFKWWIPVQPRQVISIGRSSPSMCVLRTLRQ